jgi:preprotein translocase SecE subunit
VARDRKRAKQRRARALKTTGGAGQRRSTYSDAAAAFGAEERLEEPELTAAPEPAPDSLSEPEPVAEPEPDRGGEPGAVAEPEPDGGGEPGAVAEPEPDRGGDLLEGDGEGEIYADELVDLDEDEPEADDGPPGDGGGGTAVVTRGRGGAAQVARPRARQGNRVIGFLQASWAELQRVQWPDRRQVAQATAVVMGFVVVAGVFLGLADLVAQKIVDAIL